jgi:hypothetical protein
MNFLIRLAILSGIPALANATTTTTTAAQCGGQAAERYKPCNVDLIPHTHNVDFTAILVGDTGAGKSTFVDLSAGGREVAAFGTADGPSCTEKTCAFKFQPTINGELSNMVYKYIDTPGFQDTAGSKTDVTNQDSVQKSLRNLKKADAVILLIHADVKEGPDFMAAFLFLRAYFGSQVWKRIIVVYSFWIWQDKCRPQFRMCLSCKTMPDLVAKHTAVMDKAFAYSSVELGTGDVRCTSDMSADEACFPDAKDIPFIGTGLYMQKLATQNRTIRHYNLLKTSDPYYRLYRCPPRDHFNPKDNDAEMFVKFHEIAYNVTRAPNFKQMDLQNLRNVWIECRAAHTNIELMKAGNYAQSVVANAASHMMWCFDGRVKSESETVIQQLLRLERVQAQLAFGLMHLSPEELHLTPKEHIAWIKKNVVKENGFDIFNVDNLDKYPDYYVYENCSLATKVTSAVESQPQLHCYQGLTRASPSPPPRADVAIAELLQHVYCRCTQPNTATPHNQFSCSLSVKGNACSDKEACIKDRDWNVAELHSEIRVCSELPQCSSSVCFVPGRDPGYFVYKKNPPAYCSTMHCASSDCCDVAGACQNAKDPDNPSLDICHDGYLNDFKTSSCRGTVCTREECCGEAPRCSIETITCPQGKQLKHQLPPFCKALSGCTQNECCEQSLVCQEHTCKSGTVEKSNPPTWCTADGCDVCCRKAEQCDAGVCTAKGTSYALKDTHMLPQYCKSVPCTSDDCCDLKMSCANPDDIEGGACGDGFEKKNAGYCDTLTENGKCPLDYCCQDICNTQWKYANGLCFCQFDSETTATCPNCAQVQCAKNQLNSISVRCFAFANFQTCSGDSGRSNTFDGPMPTASELIGMPNGTNARVALAHVPAVAIPTVAFWCVLAVCLVALTLLIYFRRPALSSFKVALLTDSA